MPGGLPSLAVFPRRHGCYGLCTEHLKAGSRSVEAKAFHRDRGKLPERHSGAA